MNKKGSMELSVNSIVILVIAIVMLGLILGFVKTKFADISKDLVKDEPEPPSASSSDPITMSRTAIITGAGKTLALKINLYNSGNTILLSAKPAISCLSGTAIITPDQQYNIKEIKQGEQQSFQGVIKIPNNLVKGTYLCKAVISETTTPSKDFTIEIQ